MKLLSSLALVTIASLPLYLVRFHIGPLPITALEILLVATIFVWVVEKKQKIKILFEHPVFNILICAFLIAATVSLFVAPSLRNALGIWKAYFIEPVLFFFVLKSILSRSHPERAGEGSLKKQDSSSSGTRHQNDYKNKIIFALSISALLLSLYAVIQRFTGFGIPHPWNLERRVTSIFLYPNALALFLAPLIPLFIGQIFQKNIYWKMYYALAALLSLAAIIFAHSTGALIGLIAGLFIAGLLYLFTRRPKFSILYCALLILIPILAGVILLTASSLKTVRNELLLKDWSGRVHKTVWSESWNMIKTRPITGAGLDGYQIAFKPFHKATYIEIFQYPHNIILNFWSETGLFGVMSFLGLIIYFFITSFKKLGATKYSWSTISAIAAMVAILVHGLVDVPYFKNDLAVLFWVIYALGVTL